MLGAGRRFDWWAGAIEAIGRGFLFRQTPDDDGYDHSFVVLDPAPIGPVRGNGLAGIARDRDADEIPVAEDAVGWVEICALRAALAKLWTAGVDAFR